MPRCAGTSITQRLNEEPGAGDNRYYSHITADDYKILVGEKIFNKFFKFSVIRNPYDRVYSSFKRNSTIDDVTFYDFEKWLMYLTSMDWKKKGVRGVLGSHYDWLGNPPLVDYIIRYEDFEKGWKHVCAKLGIKNTISKVNIGEYNLRGYKKYHTKKTIEIVQHYFKKDLEEFKYDF